MDVDLLKWLILSVMGIAVWFLKMTITDTKREIHDLRTNSSAQHDSFRTDLELVKREYLHRDDFKEFKSELRTMFEEIRNDVRSLNNKSNG